ncbi:MAG TPA: hypothetical protein VK870_04820 [Ignavibacteriaceae bacterium]|nr:hypothetical protein [Ignavibacteriaceae bacterium]
MLEKEKVLQTIQELPEKFSLDDLIDRIILLHKVGIGLEQSQKGKVQSTLVAKEKLSKWLK